MFVQEAPSPLKNSYRHNAFLLGLSRRFFPSDIYFLLAPRFENLADEISLRVDGWALDAERNPPRHNAYDPFGQRIDQLEISWGWKKLKEFSSQNTFVAIGYDKKLKSYRRIAQTVIQTLFSAHSATYSCPLAMTDGAVSLLNQWAPPRVRDDIVPKLLGRDGKGQMCGQWMTERTGGSDLRFIETQALFARRNDDHEVYCLYGLKWFASAIDSEYALVLATIKDEGPSLFLLKVWQDSALADGVAIEALKNKLGTKALPTAEVRLSGAQGILIGGKGQGIKCAVPILNITRFYNALASTSLMNRAFFLVESYAHKRVAFKKPLAEHTLHQNMLADLDAKRCGAIALCFELALLLGKIEEGIATETEKLVCRALTPIAKALLGKWAVQVASEAIEAMGGVGYIEDTEFPRLLRDAQAFPIWEGCTNVLVLDVVRAQAHEGAWVALLKHLCERANAVMIDEGDSLRILKARLAHVSEKVLASVRKTEGEYPIYLESFARNAVFTTGVCAMAIMLAESKPFITDNDRFAASRFSTFVENNLCGQFSW